MKLRNFENCTFRNLYSNSKLLDVLVFKELKSLFPCKKVNFTPKMASMVSKIVRKSSNCLLANHLAVARQFSALQNRKFHLTPAQDYSHLARNSDGKFMCTLIPGDGVGPELVNISLVIETTKFSNCNFLPYVF